MAETIRVEIVAKEGSVIGGPVGRRKGRVGGGPESAGLQLRHVKHGRSAGGPEWRERGG